MDFRIADTFADSLAKLTGEEQKSVKTTAFDLQLNPASPGMSLHKLDKAKDKNFWSVRVSSDIRLIVHKTAASLLLCYVDHHDKAYAWAERRKLETHPKTGAAQWVEIRDRVEEAPFVRAVLAAEPAPRPVVGLVVVIHVAKHQAVLNPVNDEPDVAADPHRPEVLVLRFVEFVKAQPWRRRVQLQVKGRGLDQLLLVARQAGEAGGESVRDSEFDHATA